MELNRNFVFTQHSLETFEACPLKFKLRYVDNLKWKGRGDRESQRRIMLGNNFHLLARRYFMGIESAPEAQDEDFEQLFKWTEALKRNFPLKEGFKYLPEYKLRMAGQPLSLEANFDLLVTGNDEVHIWDWKTGDISDPTSARRHVKRLESSIQTMVYLFVLKERIRFAARTSLECDSISMHYWNPDNEAVMAEIDYSSLLHKKYKETLENKIHQVKQYDYSTFEKEEYIKSCRYCEFNVWCSSSI